VGVEIRCAEGHEVGPGDLDLAPRPRPQRVGPSS